MNMKNPFVLTAGAFLSAWAASNFDVDYRAILWAVLAGVFGMRPRKNDTERTVSFFRGRISEDTCKDCP